MTIGFSIGFVEVVFMTASALAGLAAGCVILLTTRGWDYSD